MWNSDTESNAGQHKLCNRNKERLQCTHQETQHGQRKIRNTEDRSVKTFQSEIQREKRRKQRAERNI